MNVKNRQDLNGRTIIRDGEKITRFSNFGDIRKYLSVGTSIIYTATARTKGNNGIEVGDKVYFKANNFIGVTPFGRVDESLGSCEDVAEVIAFYTLRNIERTLGKKSILKPTPYDFAEYEHESFFSVMKARTSDMIESDRLYGCISKDAVKPGGEIVHGDSILRLVLPSKDILRSGSNTLYNYDSAMPELVRKGSAVGQEIIVHPITTRYLANTMFFDFFFCNGDRHCKNVLFQKVPIGENKFIFEPLPIIDNGGGLAMQGYNCYGLFDTYSKSLGTDGLIGTTHEMGRFNPFNVPFDFYIGKESLPPSRFTEVFDQFRTSEQLAVFLASNRTLYEDFANIYRTIDFAKAIEEMKTELRFNTDFLPNIQGVLTGALTLRRAQISEAMASYMSETFDVETFRRDETYYLNKFASVVRENDLTLHIATDEEVATFNAQFGLEEQTLQNEEESTLEQPDRTIISEEQESLPNNESEINNAQSTSCEQESLTNPEQAPKQDDGKFSGDEVFRNIVNGFISQVNDNIPQQ